MIGRRGRLRMAAGAVAAAAALALGCNGDNLFRTNTSVAAAPEISSISVPDTAVIGSSFNVKITAKGSRPISALNISLSGAVSQDIPVTVDPPATNVTQTVSVQLPSVVADTLLVVRATATDTSGAVSDTISRQIRIRSAVTAAAPAPRVAVASLPRWLRPARPARHARA